MTPQTKASLQHRTKHSRRPQHDDYMVMTRVSRNSPDTVDQVQASNAKAKKPRAHAWPAAAEQATADQPPLRKTNSMHLRQRSETMDLTQSQAESMYKKIKIKSPNKKSMHGKDSSIGASARESHPSTN